MTSLLLFLRIDVSIESVNKIPGIRRENTRKDFVVRDFFNFTIFLIFEK